MAIEIADFPIDSMVIFHSYGTVYQRVLATIGYCYSIVSKKVVNGDSVVNKNHGCYIMFLIIWIDDLLMVIRRYSMVTNGEWLVDG